MDSENKLIKFIRDRDWRIWMGSIITVLWLTGGIWYVVATSQGEPNQKFSLEAVGSFLEGVFAPLAFLWLVLGLFIQQRELANNTEALRRTSEQSVIQTQAIAATEMNARQETFFKIAENASRQLGGITGMLVASTLGPIGDGRINREQLDDYFSQAAGGDNEVFARIFLTMNAAEEGDFTDLMYGTEIRRRHTENFKGTFERIARLAKNCDVDGIIEGSWTQSGFGLLYRRMIEHQPDLLAQSNS